MAAEHLTAGDAHRHCEDQDQQHGPGQGVDGDEHDDRQGALDDPAVPADLGGQHGSGGRHRPGDRHGGPGVVMPGSIAHWPLGRSS